MTIQRTLSIIKPDATSKNIIGKIIDRFEENGLKVVAGKLIVFSNLSTTFLLYAINTSQYLVGLPIYCI